MLEGIFYLKEFPLLKQSFEIDSIKYKFRFSGLNYQKPSILIYGCSYAYGAALKDNEHLGYLLSEYLKCPVYNYALEARGIQHALYIIKHQNQILPPPKYAILVYIDDHIRRLYMTCMKIDPYYFLDYEEKNGMLVEKKDKLAIIKNTLIYKHIISDWVFPQISDEVKFKKLNMYLKEIQQELKTKYPDIKLIFLIYSRSYKINSKQYLKLTDDMLQQIRNEGIEVIDLENIFGTKLYDDKYRGVQYHPSKEAWELIVPELSKKLQY